MDCFSFLVVFSEAWLSNSALDEQEEDVALNIISSRKGYNLAKSTG